MASRTTRSKRSKRSYHDDCGEYDDDNDDGYDDAAYMRAWQRERATEALTRAAPDLDLDAMRDALMAGAYPADFSEVAKLVVNVASTYRWQSRRSPFLFPDDKEEGRELANVAALQVAALQLLAAHGLSPTDAGEALVAAAACRRCLPAVVKFLLEAGSATARSTSWALLGVQRDDVAQLLVDAGADVNIRGEWGAAPLFKCCHNGRDWRIVHVLLDAGADANARVHNGDTALAASYFAYYDDDKLRRVVPALLEAGADPTIAGAWPAPVDSALERFHRQVEKSVRSGGRRSMVDLERSIELVTAVIRAAAWHRRRHMLVAICGRHGVAVAAPPVSSARPVGAAPAASVGGAGAASAAAAVDVGGGRAASGGAPASGSAAATHPATRTAAASTTAAAAPAVSDDDIF